MRNCPFCGGDARLYTNKNWRIGRYAQVRCKSKACSARGPLVTCEGRSRQSFPLSEAHLRDERELRLKEEISAEAIRSWNARTM